jgi:TrmH family RNA methyltransferase
MRVEGRRELERALEAGVVPETAFVLQGAEHDPLVARLRAAGTELVLVAAEAFEKLGYRARPDPALVAVVPIPEASLASLEARLARGRPGPLLVLEDLEKPGNLGAVLRSADGAGAAGVLLLGRAPDLGNPNALRASLGTLFRVPLGVAGLEAGVAWIRSRHLAVVAASPRAPATLWAAELRGPVAIVLGSEAHGLSPALEAMADRLVSIPMRGSADSLNVAQAATLLVYEALRQTLSPPTPGG